MDGQTRKLPDPFFVIATQNPVEQIGAYPLPESQLDRFLMAIELGYPDAGGRARAARRRRPARADRRDRRRWRDPATLPTGSAKPPTSTSRPRCSTTCRRCSPRRAARHTAAATAMPATRRGLCPRAGLMLLAAARAWALIAARPMVLPEDVQAVFPSVAGHRLAGGTRAGAVQAQALLRAVPLP